MYFDVGLSINYVGPSAPSILGEALELAPFAKQLYSSDAFGLPELFLIGERQFRIALDTVLGNWIAEDYLSADRAQDIESKVMAGNSDRIYPGIGT